jgi:cysteine desulfurase/selenocysteine lyase
MDEFLIQNNFPIFKRAIHDKKLIFLDTAASAQKPQVVIDAMVDVMERHYANVNRGVYTLSEEVTEMVETARKKVAQFVGARGAQDIVFTRNASESINLVMYSWARRILNKGDVVVVSEMEHHSNIIPWQLLRDEIGIELVWIPVTGGGYLDWQSESVLPLKDRIKLVAVTHVSNVLGTINPIKEIVAWAHSIGSKILVDGAQAVTNVSVDVTDLDVDWYAFSGHKLYGPSGIGVLYGKRELLDAMPPFMGGGDMILEVTKEKTTYKEPPHKFEAGTPAIVEIVGLGAAVDFVSAIGMEVIREHNKELLGYTFEKFSEMDGITVYGPRAIEDKGGVIAFTMKGIHPHDIATILDEEGVAIRSGHHCAQVLCERFGQPAMARVSFGVYNSTDDVDVLINGLSKVNSIFSGE